MTHRTSMEGEIMEITKRTVGDVTILDLNGKLTIGKGDVVLRDVLDEVIEGGGKKVVINLDTVNTIERRAGNDNLGSGSADLYQQQEDHWTRAVVFYGSGSALLTTAGVLLIIDLF